MDPKILKGVGSQLVIWTFYAQVVKLEKGWVEQEFVLLIIAIIGTIFQATSDDEI